MELTAELSAPCAPAELFGWIDDLARYPQWMGLVHAATPVVTTPSATTSSATTPSGAPPHVTTPVTTTVGQAGTANGGEPAWDVELRARIGPFARSKRLTMVRTVCAPNEHVVFQRLESDGRKHSLWRMAANVRPVGLGSLLEIQLHYGGSLWTGGVLERALHDEIDRSRDRLVRLLAETRL